MGHLGTYQESLRDTIAADTDLTPELRECNIILTNNASGSAQDLDAEIQQAVANSDGLSLVIYGRSGTNPEPEMTLTMSTRLNMEIYYSPLLRDVSLHPDLRSADAILESLMILLHRNVHGDSANTCYEETAVLSFDELPDPDFHVFRVVLQRTIHFQ